LLNLNLQVVDGALLKGGGSKSTGDGGSTLTLSLLAVLGQRGVTLIAVIICASVIIIIIFLIAAVCLVRRRRNRYHKAGRGIPPDCNGDKYNCRVEALRAIKESSSSAAPVPSNRDSDHSPVQSVIQTFDSSPRTPSGRVVLLAGSGGAATGNGRLTAARWNGGGGQSCRRQLLPAAPDLVARTGGADQTLSTFGKTLPPPAKRTMSNSDVTSATPDVKV